MSSTSSAGNRFNGLQSSIIDSGIEDAQLAQMRHVSQMNQTVTGDLRSADEKRVQLVQPSEMGEALIGQLRSEEVQLCQPRKLSEVRDARVGDRGQPKIEIDERRQPSQIGEIGIRDFRGVQIDLLNRLPFECPTQPQNRRPGAIFCLSCRERRASAK